MGQLSFLSNCQVFNQYNLRINTQNTVIKDYIWSKLVCLVIDNIRVYVSKTFNHNILVGGQKKYNIWNFGQVLFQFQSILFFKCLSHKSSHKSRIYDSFPSKILAVMLIADPDGGT